MDRLRITHLTFVGSNVEPASIEFGPRATIVRGPSDTGKSFIVDALDFMFGARQLKEIPERQGYSTALLGLILPSGDAITLSRSVNGGNFGLYNSDVRGAPLGVADLPLSASHNASNEENLSRFLLSQIGLDGARVRKNARNATDSLSFRNIAHLCLVDETQMQSEVPPALTGNYTTKTKEVSVLKLLLQDEDDSSLVATETNANEARLSGAKIEVVDRLLAGLEDQVSTVGEVAEVRAQHTRLNASLAERSASIERLKTERDRLARAYVSAQRGEADTRHQLGDAIALYGRFNLLLQQYDSDLARLEMINEAGNLLGYFATGPCVFCGAEPEHQHLNQLCEGDSTYFHDSIQTERQKTGILRDDLIETMTDLDSQRNVLRQQLTERADQVSSIGRLLKESDRSLRPHRGDLNELLSKRTSVEKILGLFEQISTLERMKAQIAADSQTEMAAAASALDLAVLTEFSNEIVRRLQSWDVPIASTVRYDRNEQDVIAGDQLRSSHGKGIRAILHSAFTIALGQYCFDRDIAHPGFVILDSPLVTYRPPDQDGGDISSDDDALDERVAAAFYEDVQRNFGGQVIVMENTDPPRALDDDSVDVPFTKLGNHGRYGFFPSPPREEKL